MMELPNNNNMKPSLVYSLKLLIVSLLVLSMVIAGSRCQQHHEVSGQQQNQLLSSASANQEQKGVQQNGTSKSQDPSMQQQLSTILGGSEQLPSGELMDDDSPSGTSLSSAMLKAYIRSNSMRAYHLDLHSYRPGARFAGDPKFVNSEDPGHKLRCRNHLSHYERLLALTANQDPVLDKTPMDSLRLADTFGRPEAGLLYGNQFWLGSYDQCLDFELKLDEGDDKQRGPVSVKSQYCLGLTQFPNWNPKAGKTSIKVGLCLPETCTSSMLNGEPEFLATVERMMKQQFGETKPFNRLKLREVYCLPHETSEIRQYSKSAICLLVLIGSFVAISLIATAMDHFRKRDLQPDLKLEEDERNWRHIIIESFSITRNLQRFLYIKEELPIEKPKVTADDNGLGFFDRSTFLNTTTGLKCLGLLWIISAHTFLVGPITSSNILYADKLTQTYLADVYLGAHLMVDTFFTLSGILAAFFLFRAGIDSISTKQWIVLTVHRYWRLTPIYLLSYWFTKSVGFLLNDGPMWDYMTAEQSPRLNCARESWWDAVLHLSDFKSPKEHCVPFAWFIANGIKFWMLTPIFLILINKSVRQGYMTTISTILTSMVLVATLALRSDVDMKSVVEFKPESADDMLNNMGEVYTRPYSRIGAYLIGILAGHFMYMIDTQQFQVKISKNLKRVIWTLVTLTVLVLIFVLKIAKNLGIDESAIPLIFGITSALIRPLWAICTCWFVFALAHGDAKWLSKFLSANFWRILVKLSFCAYLSQGEVIAQLYLSMSTANSFTYVDLICRPIVTIVMTAAVSFLMVLLIEYPLAGIEELILPKKRKSSAPQTDGSEKFKSEKLKST